MRRVLLVAALALLGLAAPAFANRTFVFIVDANNTRGEFTFGAIASPAWTTIDLFERVGARRTQIGTFGPLIDAFGDPENGGYGTALLIRQNRWRCDRRNRFFEATAHDEAGNLDTERFEVRTPSCADRVRIVAPARVRAGSTVNVRLIDSWGAGDLPLRLCAASPTGRTVCRPARIPASRRDVRVPVRVPTTGEWTLSVRQGGERLAEPLAVGVTAPPRPPVILTTGDSMMQTVGVALHDRLGDQAQTYDDTFIGTGIQNRLFADWRIQPTIQAKLYHPDQVVVLLGANDRSAFVDDGTPCCGEAWIAKYVPMVQDVMRQYTAGGAKVLYATIPAGTDPERNAAFDAVNTAIVRAAAGVPGVSVLRLDRFFTPGGLFQDKVRYDGQVVDARIDDGQHFTIPGARIAADIIARRLGFPG